MTTIAQERAALKKVGRPLRTREQAGYKFKSYGSSRPVSEPSSLVFVHITITNPRNYSSDDAHARAVEAIGISRFPNTGVSYNRLVMQSGVAYEAQPIGRRGAHTVNDKNLTRCVSSGCPSRGGAIPSAKTNLNNVVRAYAICQNVSDTVTDAELDSLARTIAADILAGFVSRNFQLHGHRCVAWKDCPAAKMWARMGQLRTLINKYVASGFGSSKPNPVQEDDEMTPAQMTELKNFIEANNQKYAVACNNYTRQVLNTATQSILDYQKACAIQIQDNTRQIDAGSDEQLVEALDAQGVKLMDNLGKKLAELKLEVEGPKA
jgi:hypothetical protein